MTARNMKNSLMISLLATFIAAGASLNCEVCHGIGHSCVGQKETCPPALDRCGILLSETVIGVSVKSILKTCTESRACGTNTVINMGQSGRVVNKLYCCVGDECRKFTPTLTPMDTTPNGKVCPACFSLNKYECEEEEELQCTGDQDNCLVVTGRATRDGLVIPVVVKGCTNSDECQKLHDHSDTVSGLSVILSLSCSPAPGKGGTHISKAPRNMPDSYGVFLSMLAGFVLVKVFL